MGPDRPLWLLALAALLAGCGSQTGGKWAEGPREPTPRSTRPPPAPNRVVRPAPQGGATTVVGDAEAVAVELQFQGVGGLFQGFFADPEIVGTLGAELGPCIAGDLAVVVVTWSDETRIGTITVHGEAEDLSCQPAGVGGLDMSPLEPLGRALAHYRDAVSGKYDIRIASFRTGVKLIEGMNHCAFWLGGQYPPDGSQWSRCADFAGNQTCAEGDRREGVTTLHLPTEEAAVARACFGL